MAWTKKTINKLYQLKEEGYSILEIAQQIGVSTRVVANAIKKKNKSSSIKKKTWTKETIDRLKQLKEEGLSMSEIAKKLGVSKNTIVGKLYRLKKNNLSLWDRYLQYLKDWAETHKEIGCEGMSPACYDEFCENDDEE